MWLRFTSLTVEKSFGAGQCRYRPHSYLTAMRGHKICEFVAHSAPVNCVHLGRRSGSVLATGGDDKKVNIWSVGKQQALMVREPETQSSLLVMQAPLRTRRRCPTFLIFFRLLD